MNIWPIEQLIDRLVKQPIDKNGWPPGPWHDEPDQLDFVAYGLDCKIVRNPKHGHFCGFVRCRHDVPRNLLAEHITSRDEETYGFDCGNIMNYRPGDNNPLAEPVAYCTFIEMRRRTIALAKALRCESVWWRRIWRQIAHVLQISIQNWPREHS